MKWNIAASLLAVLVMETYAAAPADACGVKLTVKSSAPRKAVARTSNPSDVLILGNPPRRLEADLAASGHRVEVAPTASAAKRKSYAIVIVDSPEQQEEARSNFDGAVVLVRSGDVATDMRSVEQQVARKPVRTTEARAVVAARPARTPIAAGPEQPNRQVVAASEPKTTPIVTDPTPPPPPTPEKVATSTPKPELKSTQVKPPEARVEPKPRAVAKAGAVHDEVYFTHGSSLLDSQVSNSLDKAVRWLTDNASVQVMIEGHADPTGSHEINLVIAQKRAEAVRDYLVTAGVDQARLEVISYGDTRLRYGRADRRNRRAAIVPK